MVVSNGSRPRTYPARRRSDGKRQNVRISTTGTERVTWTLHNGLAQTASRRITQLRLDWLLSRASGMVFANFDSCWRKRMSPDMKARRHPRFEAFLPVQCTALGGGRSRRRPLAGKTQWVSAGGLGLLLPKALPVRIPVLVQVCQEKPRRGHVVWVDRRTDRLWTTIPHGVFFEEPVDPALISQWVSQAEQQFQPRVPVQFGVKFQYTQRGTTGHGTCLNLSRGGMFIAAPRPPRPGTEVMLHFPLPGLSHTVSVLARVVWKRGEKTGPPGIPGMGVQFLGVDPLEAGLIGTVVDRLREESSPSPDSSRFPASR